MAEERNQEFSEVDDVQGPIQEADDVQGPIQEVDLVQEFLELDDVQELTPEEVQELTPEEEEVDLQELSPEQAMRHNNIAIRGIIEGIFSRQYVEVSTPEINNTLAEALLSVYSNEDHEQIPDRLAALFNGLEELVDARNDEFCSMEDMISDHET